MFTLLRVLRAFLAVVTLLLVGCATSGYAPQLKSPSVLNDSTLAQLDYFAPDSAAAHVDVPRSRLAQFLAPGTARKDKRQLHVTVYNAPATVRGGSTVTVGNGNITADNKKAQAPVGVGDSASATDNTKAGQKGGAAATGPGSTATAVTEDAGTPWLGYLLVFLAGVLVGFVGTVVYLVRRYRSLA